MRHGRSTRAAVFGLVLVLAGCATPGGVGTESVEPLTPEQIARRIASGDEAASRGDTDQAMVDYALALEADPADADLYYKIGALNQAEGRIEVAERNFRETLKRAPRHVPARVALGLIALRRSELDGAESLLAGVIEDAPDDWRALNALGVLHDLRERYDEARVFYERALERVPTSTTVLNNHGYSYYLERRWAEAEQLFRRTVEIDPRFSQGWSNLALVYLQLGDEAKAEASFAKIVDEHQALNNVGYFELLRDRRGAARSKFEAAASRAPSYYAKAYQNLASVDAPDPPGDDSAGARVRPDPSIARPARGPRVVNVASLPGSGASSSEGAAPRRAAVGRADIRRVQRRLAELGYEPGPFDGKLGLRTREAVRQFQGDNGLPVDGRITLQLTRLIR